MKRGKLIVIEGLDGAGKGTQIKALLQHLKKLRIPHIAMREPGGTPIGEDIRAILKRTYPMEQKTPLAETLLFFAARSAVVKQIKEMLQQGITVVMDRFYLSSLAYQGAGLGMMGEVKLLCAMVLGDLRPDLQIILDIDPEVGLRRALSRDGALDDIESRDIAFFQRARECFLSFTVQYDPLAPYCYAIDGSLPETEIANKIILLCEEYDLLEAA